MILKNSTSLIDSNSRSLPSPGSSPARVISSKTVYKGKVIEVRVDRIIEPHGVPAQRELVCHSGSAVVLPWAGRDRILLVRQFRYPARQSLWELVAGSVDPGESPRQAAARELREETGYSAASFKLLFKFFPSPGILTERMHLFEATGLKRGAAQPEADERIRTRLFSLPELREMVRAKKIQDGKTLVGLLWLFACNASVSGA
jgi:ADP-ribose pyrophosphatase